MNRSNEPEYYRITLEDHVFVGMLSGAKTSPVIKVGGGGTRKCCIMRINSKAGIVHITGFVYLKQSRALADLERGPGTRLLLHACVLRAFALFPEARKVVLQDESAFPFVNTLGDTHSIPLSDHSMMIYGKTWYQRKLPGLAPETDYHERVVKFIARMRRKPRSRPFRAFWDHLRDSGSDEALESVAERKQEIRRMYMGARSFAQFFRKMHRGLPREFMCTFWAHYMRAALLFVGIMTSLRGSVWSGDMHAIVRALLHEHAGRLAVNATDEFNGVQFHVRKRMFPSGIVVKDER